jgi:hypothetical protein
MPDAAIGRTDSLLQSAAPVFVSAQALHRDGRPKAGAIPRRASAFAVICTLQKPLNTLPGGPSTD